MKDSFVITKSGYSGDDIKKVNSINPSVKTRSATEQPVYKNFVAEKNELLNEDEINAVLNERDISRGDETPQEVFERMNSISNPIKDQLLEQNKSRR